MAAFLLITTVFGILSLLSLSQASPSLPSSASAPSAGQQRHPNIEELRRIMGRKGRVMAAEDVPPELLRRGDPVQPANPYADAPTRRAAPASASGSSPNDADQPRAGQPWWRAAEAEVRGQPMEQFLPPADSVTPALNGWIRAPAPQNEGKEGGSNDGEAVIDPAAFYLAGANLEKVRPPKCHLMGCTGPLANDGDIAAEGRNGLGAHGTRACHQTFVPMNGCWDGRGYPVGMVCTICCECSAELGAELRRSYGWAHKYRAAPDQ